MVSPVGHPDLTGAPRGLVIFPADEPETRQERPSGEWWLVVAAILVAGAMIAIAFAIR